MNTVNRYDSDRSTNILGVPGRLKSRMTGNPGWRADVWVNQSWVSEARPIKGYGRGAVIRVDIRLDDKCKNGHSTFSITAEISIPGRRDCEACGCLHDDIAKAFPELAGLIRWHLTSTDGPMHYIANAVYHAGDRDHNGLRKGERRPLTGPDGKPRYSLRAIIAPGVAISAAHLKVSREGVAYQDGETASLYALETNHKGEGVPVPPVLAWVQDYREGEGKTRDLDAARRAAVWPDATDAELSVEPSALKAALSARYPRLMEQFRTDMEAAGFFLFPADYVAPRA